jgi:AbrB family looped-hinge helix DNA binding protein
MQLVLDKFGRVGIPKVLRDELGLAPGDMLDVEEQPECIILRHAPERGAVTHKDGLLVFSGAAADDLTGALARHRRERIGRGAALGMKR